MVTPLSRDNVPSKCTSGEMAGYAPLAVSGQAGRARKGTDILIPHWTQLAN